MVAWNINTIVECGDTNPDKLFMEFESNPEALFVIMPFVDTLGHVVYLFQTSEAGKQKFKERSDLFRTNAAAEVGL